MPRTLSLGQNPHSKVRECDDDCAEEECDPDQCGAENTAPLETLTCGLDTRFVLPGALSGTVTISGITIAFFQWPLSVTLFSLDKIQTYALGLNLALLYLITLGCMAYCTLADPGQMTEQAEHSFLPTGDMQPEAAFRLPKRAHKTWQYPRAVRRYDHYCRWVTNSIGLFNHRQFFVMCVGIVVAALSGAIMDVVLFIKLVELGFDFRLLVLAGHLTYSLLLFCLAGPILRIHIGLVSRNELANEWKRNEFYVAKRSKRGKDTPVNELSDDEFNALFDDFAYDKRKNKFDKGWTKNCWLFWCTPRSKKEQLGEF